MSSSVERRQAIKEYKARKPFRGIFAVRCASSGQVWVGASPNLHAARNGIWFTLNHGSHLDKSLQAAWNAHGEQSFQYEVLEELKDDVSPLSVRDLLNEAKAGWAQRLGAPALL